ncbi:GIY-YIG nuclease family protein [Lactiplantibacillus pentosus]|uniref:GIY-YIG nuclease family protein n=1 Tax=Lactiplantibacillus pentosus TaxID=1589 RepID=UPI0021A72E5A|nr:GIY-YIG nuclease family protein [Lactiplantibacillus pentosus]MCT3292987.1 GIY-YIG nuclease family protein [Lactiplantibacillus pentosus]
MQPAEKHDLQQRYKLAATYYGVIQITNERNHKIWIDVVPNLHNRWAFYQLNLNKNFYRANPLQTDWNQQTPADFSYQVLWQKETTAVTNMRATLKELKNKWLHDLQPFDEHGYNRRPKDWQED